MRLHVLHFVHFHGPELNNNTAGLVQGDFTPQKIRKKINTPVLDANIPVAEISFVGIQLNQKQAFMYTCEIETPIVGC